MFDANWFLSLDDAKAKIAAWRKDYNENRPHSALHRATRAEFARQCGQHEPESSNAECYWFGDRVSHRNNNGKPCIHSLLRFVKFHSKLDNYGHHIASNQLAFRQTVGRCLGDISVPAPVPQFQVVPPSIVLNTSFFPAACEPVFIVTVTEPVGYVPVTVSVTVAYLPAKVPVISVFPTASPGLIILVGQAFLSTPSS